MKNLITWAYLLSMFAVNVIRGHAEEKSVNDFSKFLLVKEMKHYKELARSTFSDKPRIVVDTDSIIVIGFNSEMPMPTEVQPLTVCLSALGPISSNPTPLITSNGPAQLLWSEGKITGENLILEPQSLNLDDGKEIQIRAVIIPNSDASCTSSTLPETTSTTGILYVEFRDFGLSHHESDSILFIRSSQSSSWDTRPGASAMFGWNSRTHYKWGRLWRFISPMGGVNVSLLDFDKDQTIEFGVGPAISFIEGGFIFGSGWNLSTNFRQRRYFYLGVSFLNIASFIKKNVDSSK